MSLQYVNYSYLASLVGPFLAGFSAYSFLSYLFVVPTIAIPLSTTLFFLVFGLTRYYSTQPPNNDNETNTVSALTSQNNSHQGSNRKVRMTKFGALFVTIFTGLIVIASFTHEKPFHVFTDWQEIGLVEWIQLGSAISLCFFVPGFAIALLLTKKYPTSPLLSVLLGYLFSMLITGLISYISALTFDIATSDTIILYISTYVIIMVIFLVFYPVRNISKSSNVNREYIKNYHYIVTAFEKFYRYFKTRANEFIVFGSLFSLIVILTYYLYGSITIGDQWYHQGRSLLFMSGAFREATLTGAESFYPPFQSALLATVAVMSGVPLVNAYAVIGFVNFIPILAYYYFFSIWVPSSLRRAVLLACTLFTISSGFGWIYLLATTTRSQVFSINSSLETLRNIGHIDFISASNFVLHTAPDFSTGLVYIALPAGFVLLGIVRASFQSKYTRVAIVATISILGTLSHYEFYIFIIIASILPIIFNLKTGNQIYLGFLLALLIIKIIDLSAPGAYLSSVGFSGLELLPLMLLFVIISWLIYLVHLRLIRSLERLSSQFYSVLKQRHRRLVRPNFYAATLVVFIASYLYLLTFIVLSQISFDTIIDHTSGNNIPWYIYPMKMGMTGLFGLMFILSYLFNKFDKHIFVFGVIMLVSLIAGPFYDEHRFSKYFMTGMVGFASLMIYQIFSLRFAERPIVKGIIVGTIVATSGLSILGYIGFGSLILQSQDFTNTQSRRHFPADSDLRLFEALHDNFDVNSERYNVISFLKEYYRAEDGLISKITSFAGLPHGKLHQDPLALNASTMEALLQHLSYSGAHYLIVPKNMIQNQTIIDKPTLYVIGNFPTIYQDNNYAVLEVPYLVPPSSSSDANIGIVDDTINKLPERMVSDIVQLPYNSSVFDLKAEDKVLKIQKPNATEVLSLAGAKMERGSSVWTNINSTDVNYIQTGYQIITENHNKPNDVRIEWEETGNGYYVKHSKHGLELYKKSDSNTKVLLKNTLVDKVNGRWYALQIESQVNSINIYLDGVLKIHVTKNTLNNSAGISKVGLTTFYNDVQFLPVRVGAIPEPKNFEAATNYDYYPITLMALTQANYDSFSDKDPSILSKNVIVVQDSLLSDNVTINKYLNYVHDGGTLVTINSNGNFSILANNVFPVKSNSTDQEAFTQILDQTDQNTSIKVPGWIKRTDRISQPDLQVIAEYKNDRNETIAPFILEKAFPSGGKIILLNAEGYFSTLSNLPNQYFSSLNNVTSMLPINLSKIKLNSTENDSLPMQGFVGKMKTSGATTLSSSSFLLGDDSNGFPINTSRIVTSYKESNTMLFNNTSIKRLNLYGDYQVDISYKGKSELPDDSSYYDYIGIRIPTVFNMSVRFADKGSGWIDIDAPNDLSSRSITLYNNSKIEFHDMKIESPLDSIGVILKRPEIKVDGQVFIMNAYLDGYLSANGKLDMGTPVDLEGRLLAKIAFVDDFYLPYQNTTKKQYITYFRTLSTEGKFDQGIESLKLPGDIYFGSKEGIPLVKILISPINIICLSVLIIVAVFVGKVLRRKYIPVSK